ncbi:MAG: hypothetical protein ACOYK8_06850 [Alphaproteobacteria bacterium]
MQLSPNLLVTLVDLVENKLSSMEVLDMDDAREQALLRRCLQQLQLTLQNAKAVGMKEDEVVKKRGRRPKVNYERLQHESAMMG